MLNYPITLTADSNGAYLVAFADLPAASASGADREDALHNAAGTLAAAFETYVEQRRPIPAPSKPAKGQPVVTLSVLETAKVLLWNEMHAQKLRKAGLARRLHAHMSQVDRLFDLKHASQIESVEKAAKALGKCLTVTLT